MLKAKKHETWIRLKKTSTVVIVIVMPNLPSVVVMSGAGKKQKRWSRLEKKG